MTTEAIPVEAVASFLLGYFLNSPARNERGAYMAAPMVAEVKRTAECPMSRKQQLIVTAAAPLKCDEPATVITAVPMRNQQTGELFTAPQKLCLHHSVEAACWKLTYAILEHDRQVAKARKIITAVDRQIEVING